LGGGRGSTNGDVTFQPNPSTDGPPKAADDHGSRARVTERWRCRSIPAKNGATADNNGRRFAETLSVPDINKVSKRFVRLLGQLTRTRPTRRRSRSDGPKSLHSLRFARRPGSGRFVVGTTTVFSCNGATGSPQWEHREAGRPFGGPRSTGFTKHHNTLRSPRKRHRIPKPERRALDRAAPPQQFDDLSDMFCRQVVHAIPDHNSERSRRRFVFPPPPPLPFPARPLRPSWPFSPFFPRVGATPFSRFKTVDPTAQANSAKPVRAPFNVTVDRSQRNLAQTVGSLSRRNTRKNLRQLELNHDRDFHVRTATDQ